MIAKFLKTLLISGFLALLVGYSAYLYMANYWAQTRLELASPELVVIEKGQSMQAVLAELFERDLIPSVTLSKIALVVNMPNFVLKHGVYEFDGELSLRRLFESLHSGVSVQRRVTFIEGWSVQQLLHDDSTVAQFPNQAYKPAELITLISEHAKTLMGETESAEGWFYPDTYFYSPGDTFESILVRAHHKMMETLRAEWSKKEEGLPYASSYDALIMASLIERETAVADEYAPIAGVFVRRLHRGMRLQTDPTVIYGMGASYQGNLTRADLRRDTPYNTYTRNGLPPTPIALPSAAAIRAALNPEVGTALYFVAKGDGRHHFSDTLEEHQKAVRRYQVLRRRADYRSTPDA